MRWIALEKTIGDGKIFVSPVEEVIRILNGDRGELALQGGLIRLKLAIRLLRMVSTAR